MKTSIPSDVWETKRSQIAALYKEEEWPLKQVIKQIRSKDFNPTETQLRSRLKKWGVTKPSRQRRKKAPNQATNAVCAVKPSQAPRNLHRRCDSDPQVLSLPIPVSSPTEPERRDCKPLIPAANNELHQAMGTPGYENNPPASGMNPSSDVFLHTAAGNAYQAFPVPQLRNNAAPPPPLGSYDRSQYGSASVNSANHCNTEAAASVSRPGSLSSIETVPPTNLLSGGMAIGWRPQKNPVDPEIRSTGSPANRWSYTPPATCQPCSPSCLYFADSMPISPVGYPDYTKSAFPDSAQSYPLCPSLSPTSDISFWEPAPAYRTWRNGSSASDQIAATMNPLKIDRTPPTPHRQHGASQRMHHESLARDRGEFDTKKRSPMMLPELTTSGSDSEAHAHEFSPLDGADMEYLLPSPVMN